MENFTGRASQWKPVRWQDWRNIRNAVLVAGYAMPKLKTMIRNGHAKKIKRGQYQLKCKFR